ncbi:MAG: NAD(P)-dependent oxidoreductase [Deltaproteobacteria bacterium]|nr:NAD(P)-dependent oxidoreductase [Deltaproteobacteria bacterium]
MIDQKRPARTLVDLAKAEAAKPFTIGDLSPAETAAMGAKWAEQMKPRLLEAAREQRALRAADLVALDGIKDGDGLALDDVLDFLLSPQGAPLQALLEKVSAPDHPIALLPGLDDDDPPPWSAPPKDRFEAHLRTGHDAMGLDPRGLMRAAVKSLAEATGKNGRVDVAAVATQGPVASALYTLIASKTQGKPQPNPAAGQKLVGLDDATVARIGRGVDVAPILGRMKAFDVVVDRLIGDGKPLAGVKVIAIQHLMPTFAGVLDALERAGVERGDMRVIGKSYSTVDEMYAWMHARGYDVHPGSIGGDAASVEERLVEAAKSALEELFDGVDPKTSTQRYLLADDGGKLLYALHKYFPEYAHLCSGFEQTARGIQVLEKMEAEGIPVQCPVVNMAKSALKANTEIPLIGENVVFDSLRYLDEMKIAHPKTATVLGYGPVGEQVARALRARGVDVVVFDPDPRRQAQAVAAGCSVLPREQALGAGDMVIGCTGRGALDVVDDHPLLKSGAVLVNGASGNHELGTQSFGKRGRWFLETAFEADRFSVVGGGAASAMFQGKRVALGQGDLGSASMHRVMKGKDTGKEVLVLRSGHVVNLGRDLPPEFIQVTRALVFASLVQSFSEEQAGVVDVDPRLQKMIEDETLKDLAAQGLSLSAPDFSQLKSWDL